MDLKSDIGIQGRKSEALLKVVFKPARKHRLNFEAVPYRFNGANNHINGEVNGIWLGSEGNYVQGNLNAGVAVGRDEF